MTAHEIEFVDEIPKAVGMRAAIEWAEVAEKLRADPGHWAIVLRDAKSGTASVLVDRLKNRYGLDAARRKIDGAYTVYARWPEETP